MWGQRVELLHYGGLHPSASADLELSHLVLIHTSAAISEGTMIAVIQSLH